MKVLLQEFECRNTQEEVTRAHERAAAWMSEQYARGPNETKFNYLGIVTNILNTGFDYRFTIFYRYTPSVESVANDLKESVPT